MLTRWSGGAKDPKMAQAPEGPIDPWLKTITLARGDKPLVRLHYYATHPQTFCCDGRASADFVGLAREAVERQDKVFQIYFTGCSGDVTVGKYNDGSPRPRPNSPSASSRACWHPLRRRDSRRPRTSSGALTRSPCRCGPTKEEVASQSRAWLESARPTRRPARL